MFRICVANSIGNVLQFNIRAEVQDERLAGHKVIVKFTGTLRKVSTLVLVHRTDLLRQWRERLIAFLDIPKDGLGQIGGGKKQRTTIFVELESLDDSAPRVLLATGRLIGEGFDHPALDTLMLVMPISRKGTLQQYAGRLHREHADKQNVRIYDYIENDQPQLARMWAKRQRGYRAMGYLIKSPDELF